ncbi:methyltransferase family protein [Frigoriflavimonas asaccharolytica]|uniref:Protein-S-isoprenylcysteine O-methyltransferase Ste14 n=1 Tax=Frigoriflavimonas asaccharolytica TaxID=2735899 RepID=A0A8J8G7D8_9FLAO|nr:isoprenylcysteine carboxylmethyltransferase family protein [Frigoriflavimonas asaccharolytica]NRS91332.1 protein-S-isoprenylcysteine O-methyltransferase Ste14 [Frigoriflavimonas asaccharolytica]
MKNTKPLKDYLFVTIQLLIFAAYSLPITISTINLPEWLRYLGLFMLILALLLALLTVAQLNKNISPFPTPVQAGKLMTTGAFSISRHPIYTGLLFSGIGYGIHQESLYKLLITFILAVLFYFKSKYEETLLSKKFPEYESYKSKTRRFI